MLACMEILHASKALGEACALGCIFAFARTVSTVVCVVESGSVPGDLFHELSLFATLPVAQ